MRCGRDIAFMAVYDLDGEVIRTTRWFSPKTEAATEACWQALYATTNEEKLMELSGGNKWIIRRAIEMYRQGVASADAWDGVRFRLNARGVKFYKSG